MKRKKKITFISFLKTNLTKQFQLVLSKKQFLRHFVFVGRNEAFYILLNQFDRCGFPRLAVVAQRAVLPRRQLESYRMVLVVATLPFRVFLCHNTLI